MGIPPNPSSPRSFPCPHWQTDIKMPRRQLRQLEDQHFNSRFQAAIEAAVQASRLALALPQLPLCCDCAVRLPQLPTDAARPNIPHQLAHPTLHPPRLCRQKTRTAVCSTWVPARGCTP